MTGFLYDKKSLKVRESSFEQETNKHEKQITMNRYFLILNYFFSKGFTIIFLSGLPSSFFISLTFKLLVVSNYRVVTIVSNFMAILDKNFYNTRITDLVSSLYSIFY